MFWLCYDYFYQNKARNKSHHWLSLSTAFYFTVNATIWPNFDILDAKIWSSYSQKQVHASYYHGVLAATEPFKLCTTQKWLKIFISFHPSGYRHLGYLQLFAVIFMHSNLISFKWKHFGKSFQGKTKNTTFVKTTKKCSTLPEYWSLLLDPVIFF